MIREVSIFNALNHPKLVEIIPDEEKRAEVYSILVEILGAKIGEPTTQEMHHEFFSRN